jgi:acetyl-CoA acetyltransferase family protein
MAVLAAGFPVDVAGATVNRMCGSSLETTNAAAASIIAGQADLVIAGGVESMSRVPMMSDGGQVPESITDHHNIVMQGLSAEMIAEQWGISREDQDEYALLSQGRAIAARAAGHFAREIAPIDITSPEGETVTFSADETPRESTAEKLASLKPAFLPEGVGTVTAGNASQICDGASGVLLASRAAVDKYGLTPRAKFVSSAVAGVDPTIMLSGNPAATNRALERAGLSLADIAVVEVNEAFASVVLQAVSDLGLGDRMEDVNPLGGGISLGHPLGASGTRILATMLSELERRDAQHGLATMCIGFGQAVATLVERV